MFHITYDSEIKASFTVCHDQFSSLAQIISFVPSTLIFGQTYTSTRTPYHKKETRLWNNRKIEPQKKHSTLLNPSHPNISMHIFHIFL